MVACTRRSPSSCFNSESIDAAAFAGKRNTVELLSKMGADVNALNSFGKTPLEISIDNQHEEVKSLLSLFKERQSE